MNIEEIARKGSAADLQRALSTCDAVDQYDLIDALCSAAIEARLENIRVLLNAGVSPNGIGNRGGMPLFYAVESDSVDAVELLVRGGADVNCRDSTGWLPLQAAIDYEADSADQCREPIRANISSKLLELGADPTMTNDDGLSAIEIARKVGHEPFLRLIGDPGAARRR
jgi:ankyrin repeat protein